MKSAARLLALLKVLRDWESASRSFRMGELALATGYTLSSLQTYFKKKWEGRLLVRGASGELMVQGAMRMQDDEFLRLMSQNSPEVARTPDEVLVQGLRQRSKDAFVLALELYNRPST